MDLNTLEETPPWEWLGETGKMLLGIIRDDQADESDRLLAAELAGDYTIIDDEVADALLSILRSSGETEELRGRAAISLGPALEDGWNHGFEDVDDTVISEKTFRGTQDSLRKLYMDGNLPKDVRRSILEAAARAPEDWHKGAVRSAYSSDDEAWRLTAVFCMRFFRGFENQILEALESKNPDIHYQAVHAAGDWGVDAAWPHITPLFTDAETDKSVLLPAIGGVVNIRPQEAGEILGHLIDSEDEDIVEAAYEALAMAEAYLNEEASDEEDDDESFH